MHVNVSRLCPLMHQVETARISNKAISLLRKLDLLLRLMRQFGFLVLSFTHIYQLLSFVAVVLFYYK